MCVRVRSVLLKEDGTEKCVPASPEAPGAGDTRAGHGRVHGELTLLRLLLRKLAVGLTRNDAQLLVGVMNARAK